VIQYFDNGLVELFRVANNHLANVPYFAGDEVSVADIGFFPTYDSRKDHIASLGFRHLSAWGDRIGMRTTVRNGMNLEEPRQSE
jgi:glutathione S-transferase